MARSGIVDAFVRRLVRNILGFVLIIAGCAMILLPGPGWLTIAVGLALLAPDFVWAQAALDRLKRAGERMRDALQRNG
jgi:uncharacterized protein (TIGR02611 family)